MRVRDIMTPKVECVAPEATLQEAAAKMKTLEVGSLPVCSSNGRLVGMLTDRDIAVRAVAEGENPVAIRVRDIMTQEVISCWDDDLVAEAARVMEEHQIRRLIVSDRQRHLVGIVSLGDVALATRDEELAGATLEAISEPRR